MNRQAQSTYWMTAEAHRRLQVALADVTSQHAALKSGNHTSDDLTTLHEELETTLARQRRLEELLDRVVVGDTCPDDGVVEPGMVVTVRFAPGTDEETFLLGPRELLEFDPSLDVEVYSVASPLGAALLNATRGDRIRYRTPTGAELMVDIVDARPFGS